MTIPPGFGGALVIDLGVVVVRFVDGEGVIQGFAVEGRLVIGRMV